MNEQAEIFMLNQHITAIERELKVEREKVDALEKDRDKWKAQAMELADKAIILKTERDELKRERNEARACLREAVKLGDWKEFASFSELNRWRKALGEGGE